MRVAGNRRRTAAFALAAIVASASAWSLADAALVGAGVGAAGASAAFAGLMVAQDARPTRVNGLEYLAIFAQPNGARRRPDVSAPAPPEPVRQLAASQIDDAPTGSIGAARSPGSPPDSAFHLVAGRRDLAWVRQGATIRAVRPGDSIPGLGSVGAIVRRGESWVLLDPAGAVLLGANAGDDAGAQFQARRFSKSLIFD